MSLAWDSPCTDPSALHDGLAARLARLDALLGRLRGDAPQISGRELSLARSQTKLSARLQARIQREAAAPVVPSSPRLDESPSSFAALDNPELLEHALSFVQSPGALARCGEVCAGWYLASRMHSLWERQLRASGKLGPSPAAPMVFEDEYTLCETFGRIHAHGCRPLDSGSALAGTIDAHVDDLAAYDITARIVEPDGARAPLAAGTGALSLASGPGGALYSGSHASRGPVTIRCLCTAEADLLRTARTALGRAGGLPCATSPHLQPVLQTICCEARPAATASERADGRVHAFVVTPAFDVSLEHRLKGPPLPPLQAWRIFQQVAHGLASLHAQGFAHGRVLLPSVVLASGPRPLARLDRVHAARRVLPHPAVPHLAPAGWGEEAAGEPAAVEIGEESEEGEASEGRRREEAAFSEVLTAAWSGYERLGLLGSVSLNQHQNLQLGGGGMSAHPFLAADVADLGRLLLRMLLQPFKSRAAAAAQWPATPPQPSAFAPQLRRLILSLVSPTARARPTARHVFDAAGRVDTAAVAALTPGGASSEGELEERVGSLCSCWQRVDAAARGTHVAPSDLRLLRRSQPRFSQLSLAGSASVTDEWLEALAAGHAATLQRLDLTGCTALSRSERPLKALRSLTALRVLRLPAMLWEERSLAECLASLPHLCSLDAASCGDLHRAREALHDQCSILCNILRGK
mmetsp:Transcript_12083/g.36282  ORF Transcript_12083/g.36282 Transcript_12083/m.36282 type:complete len:695 (-) Transcript_12083:120-2204(-)